MIGDTASRADDRLAKAVAALFPASVALGVTDPNADHPTPFAEETAAMARARPSRRREFLAGRAAARQAMRAMGLPAAPVPVGADRAPVWPSPVTGSLSHGDGVCLAALARRRDARALGLDIEPALPLEPELTPEICTASERAWLSRQPENTQGRLVRLIFSAKECAYKCQYPVSSTFLEFHDLEITADLDTGQFEATFLRAAPGFPRATRLCGRYLMTPDRIVTAIALAPVPAR